MGDSGHCGNGRSVAALLEFETSSVFTSTMFMGILDTITGKGAPNLAFCNLGLDIYN